MKELLTRRRCLLSVLCYLVLAIAVLVITPLIGGEQLDMRLVRREALEGKIYSADSNIFFFQRIPRVALAFVAGAALAAVGCVFQVILRNPLAAPATLGATAGGALGAVIAISIPGFYLRVGPFSSIQMMALAGAALTLSMIYVIARRPQGVSMNTLLLAGVTMGIFCGAMNMLVQYLASPHRLVAMNRWMMGGLDVVGYRDLAAMLPLLAPGLGLLFMQMASLNHLALGNEMAAGHGVDVRMVHFMSFVGGSLATASVVSVAGPITLVGLLVPHAVRRISGFDHRVVLPGAFLLGGSLLAVCDTVARVIVRPTEMPVGIITAVVGGPFFIYLLLKRR